MKIYRHSTFLKKAFFVLFLYMMAFGYLYAYFLQQVSIEEDAPDLSPQNINIGKRTFTEMKVKTRVEMKPSLTAKYYQITRNPKPNNRKSNSKQEKPKLNDFAIEQKQHQINKEQSFRKSYAREFQYPLYINLKELVLKLESGDTTDVEPINPHSYKLISSPRHSCQYNSNSPDPKIVVLVKSSVTNFEKRQTIRNTWAKSMQSNMHIVFLLGLPEDKKVTIWKESSENGDIIQEEFLDSYRNNTLKMIMGFRWAASNCQSTDFLFFVDDDYYVNLDNLLTFVQSKSPNDMLNVFTGTLLPHSTPYRVAGSKWFVPWEEYPFDKWPPYLAGGAYIVSMDLARKFNIAFPFVRYLYIDDAYLGIVAKKLEIKPTSNKFIGYRRMPKSALKHLIASHGYSKKQDVENAWMFLRAQSSQTRKLSN